MTDRAIYRGAKATLVDYVSRLDSETLEAEGPGVVLGDSYDVLRCLVGRRTRPDADAMLKWGETIGETRDGFSVFGWKD